MRRFIAPAPDAPVVPGSVPTFSVIIPAYQAADFIADAIRSALAQTVEPHELIVCDDGSTDDLASAVAPFRDRIVLLQRPHRGVGAARNAALRAASGDFIVMLDADDVYEPERLSALGELASARPDLDLLGTDLYYEEAGRLVGRLYESTWFPVEYQRLRILETCFVACPALRRRLVLDVGGFDESLEVAGDWELFMRLILGGSQVGIVDETLMRYRKRRASITADRARSLAGRVAVLEKIRLHSGLTLEERRFLDGCLARARSRAVINGAKELCSSPGANSRRSLLALAKAPDLVPSTRIALTAARFAPVGAASLLKWEEQRVTRSRVPRARRAADS